jgi:hypothetical protein
LSQAGVLNTPNSNGRTGYIVPLAQHYYKGYARRLRKFPGDSA